MYTLQHYVIKFVTDLRMSVVLSSKYADRNHITEILLKVALNTITLMLTFHHR
jgi:hypothetical protein